MPDFGFLYGCSLMDNSLVYIQKSLKYETDLNSFDFISEIKDFKSQKCFILPNLRVIIALNLLQLITTYTLRTEYLNV